MAQRDIATACTRSGSANSQAGSSAFVSHTWPSITYYVCAAYALGSTLMHGIFVHAWAGHEVCADKGERAQRSRAARQLGALGDNVP